MLNNNFIRVVLNILYIILFLWIVISTMTHASDTRDVTFHLKQYTPEVLGLFFLVLFKILEAVVFSFNVILFLGHIMFFLGITIIIYYAFYISKPTEPNLLSIVYALTLNIAPVSLTLYGVHLIIRHRKG